MQFKTKEDLRNELKQKKIDIKKSGIKSKEKKLEGADMKMWRVRHIFLGIKREKIGCW
jgi:hypothetical protein